MSMTILLYNRNLLNFKQICYVPDALHWTIQYNLFHLSFLNRIGFPLFFQVCCSTLGAMFVCVLLVSWPRFLEKHMNTWKFVCSLIDLKAPAHVLMVNFVHESFQHGWCILTVKYAFIEHYNSVGRIVSNENTAQWDILNCPCGIILVLEQMCVYQPWSLLISKRFLHRIENIFVCVCKNEKKKNPTQKTKNPTIKCSYCL